MIRLTDRSPGACRAHPPFPGAGWGGETALLDDERKAEFLNTAMGLFLERGYEDTSVNAIIDAVGVSKRAFYHYFRTKEDLLDELAARAGEQAMALTAPVVEDPGLSAIEKMNAMFARTNAFKAQNRELTITLARIFAQGKAEGTMSIAHPAQTAALILELGATVVSGFARKLGEIDSDPSVADELLLSMEIYTESVERILAHQRRSRSDAEEGEDG